MKKGMTLTSVVIYVIVMLIVVGTVGTITGFFYSSTQNLEESADSLGEFNKFNTFFLEEVKLTGNEIERIEDARITFTSGTTFTFVDGGLYKDKVKICSNVNACRFVSYKQEEKRIIQVYLEIGQDFAKSIEYVMNQTVTGMVGQYEGNYSQINSKTILIYTYEQLMKIGSGEMIQINGENYTFSSDSTYILKNDIEFEYNGIWEIPENTKIESDNKQIIIKDNSKVEETYYYYKSINDYKFAITEEGYVYNGLILSYNGENNTGNGHNASSSTWTDLSGNGNHATLSTTSNVWSEDSLVFSNDNTLYISGQNNVLYEPEEYTIEYTIESNIIQQQCLYCSRTAMSQGVSVFILSNKIRIDNGASKWETNITIPTNIKTNIIITRTNTEIKLYIDGVLKATTSIIGDKQSANASIYTIGQSQVSGSNYSNQFSGKMYNINIYDRALTDDEIANNLEKSMQ